MGAEGAANNFSREIKAADDPELPEKIDEYSEAMMNPYVAAARGYLDDVIMPAESRQRLISSLTILSQRAPYLRKAREHSPEGDRIYGF